MARTVKIPQHNTERGTWCRFSGCDSKTGVCPMCRPEPNLSEREIAALVALAPLAMPATGDYLASLMCDAGRDTSPAAAHQAGTALTRKGLATKGRLPGGASIRYEATSAGRDWIPGYRAAGGVI